MATTKQISKAAQLPDSAIRKTLSFDEGLGRLELERSETHDVRCTLHNMLPTMDQGCFVLEYTPTNQRFVPTEHAMRQLANICNLGASLPPRLQKNEVTKRPHADAEMLKHLFQTCWAFLNHDKMYLFRTRTDGTLRAALTGDYGVIENDWYLRTLSRLLPTGRLSHWRGDSDTIWGNVLLPDTLHQESDSEYGAMLSVANCEIGSRRLSQLPSLYRTICHNGMIVQVENGVRFTRSHRGQVDLMQLERAIAENISNFLPLAIDAAKSLLALRSFSTTFPMKPIFAVVARDYKLKPPQATAVLDAWHVETKVVPEHAKTPFAIANAITRAGQRLSNEKWYAFDTLGGKFLAETDEDRWDNIVYRSQMLGNAQVDNVFSATKV